MRQGSPNPWCAETGFSGPQTHLALSKFWRPSSEVVALKRRHASLAVRDAVLITTLITEAARAWALCKEVARLQSTALWSYTLIWSQSCSVMATS